MKKLVFIAIAFIIIWYVSYYYRSPKMLNILQTSLNDFVFDMLYEKQPIVIHDRVQDVSQLERLWFPQNKREVRTVTPANPEVWMKNKYKYMLVQPQTESVDVIIAHASTKIIKGAPDTSTTLVAIHLEPLQLVILPYRIWFTLSSQHKSIVKTIGIHDMVSRWLP